MLTGQYEVSKDYLLIFGNQSFHETYTFRKRNSYCVKTTNENLPVTTAYYIITTDNGNLNLERFEKKREENWYTQLIICNKTGKGICHRIVEKVDKSNKTIKNSNQLKKNYYYNGWYHDVHPKDYYYKHLMHNQEPKPILFIRRLLLQWLVAWCSSKGLLLQASCLLRWLGSQKCVKKIEKKNKDLSKIEFFEALMISPIIEKEKKKLNIRLSYHRNRVKKYGKRKRASNDAQWCLNNSNTLTVKNFALEFGLTDTETF
ncbi:hypothetical protein BDC45DRAFT_534785 [Circinella umbellata]|nr:hypothetical protein BDC45DRAFT_534785 [Circinella umbellata]